MEKSLSRRQERELSRLRKEHTQRRKTQQGLAGLGSVINSVSADCIFCGGQVKTTVEAYPVAHTLYHPVYRFVPPVDSLLGICVNP